MALNESISYYINTITLESVINQVLFFFGGLAGITLIYFIAMIFFQYKSYERLKILEEKVDKLMRKKNAKKSGR